MSRRAKLWLYPLGLVLDLLFVWSAVRAGSTAGVILWSVFGVITGFALLQTLRDRPWPELTVDRLRVLRLQAVALALVATALAVVLVLVSPSAQRAASVVMAVVFGAVAVLGAWLAIKLSGFIARDEVPARVKQAFDERERARRLRG